MSDQLSEGDVERITERMIARSLSRIADLVACEGSGSGCVKSVFLRQEILLLVHPKPPAQPMFTLTPTGETRRVKYGEGYLQHDGTVRIWGHAVPTANEYPILLLDRIDDATQGSK